MRMGMRMGMSMSMSMSMTAGNTACICLTIVDQDILLTVVHPLM